MPPERIEDLPAQDLIPQLAVRASHIPSQSKRSIPGQVSNPPSKLRMRLVPAFRITATCKASRAERPSTEPISVLAARISDMPKVRMSSAIASRLSKAVSSVRLYYPPAPKSRQQVLLAVSAELAHRRRRNQWQAVAQIQAMPEAQTAKMPTVSPPPAPAPPPSASGSRRGAR